MEMIGKIEVFRTNASGQSEKISEGHNTFTNAGRQHVCNWLLHDNYSDDLPWNGTNPLTGGRSISTFKIIPYTDFTVHRIGTHSYVDSPQNCMYPLSNVWGTRTRLGVNNTTWSEGSYNPQMGTLYWQFTTPKNLKGVVIWGYREEWNRGSTTDISTSPNTFAENTNWTRQNVKCMNFSYESAARHHMFWWFDHHNYPNRTISNVKTLRLRTRNDYSSGYWSSISGIWFLEANDYPNTPSVIALGTGNNTPDLANTALQTESFRKFIMLHKTANDNQIKYTLRLNQNEANGVTFKEVGLFFNPIAGDYLGGDHQASVSTGLFARGLFDTPWSKTSDYLVDVDYTVTINT